MDQYVTDFSSQPVRLDFMQDTVLHFAQIENKKFRYCGTHKYTR